jgi:hypothetical protein
MKHFFPASVYLLTLAAIISCATAPSAPSVQSAPSAPEPAAPPPEWFLDVNAVYPAARYIAQRGRGASREAAETEGIAAISRYFSSEMSASTRSAYTNVQQNGADSETIVTETDNYVQSHTKLFAVRYAQDPYRNPQTNQWETVAYIEREEAWEAFEPEAKKLGDSFLSLAREADAEEDPLKRFFALKAAERYAQSPDYTRTVAFGQLLAPARMNAAFAEPRAAESELAQKIDAARREATVFVDCPLDSDALVTSALTKALGAEGFAAAKTREDAAEICLASVTEGARTDSSGITAYFPSVTITLAGKSGEALFSCSIAAERQAAMTAEVAKRRAYTALAQAVTDNFSKELNENFGK